MKVQGLEKRAAEFPESVDTPQFELRKPLPHMAEIIFTAIDQDRKRLEEHLPWVSSTATLEDEKRWLEFCGQWWKLKTEIPYAMFDRKNQFMGVVSLHTISWQNRRAEIGYWLLEKFEGQGHITQAVKTLEELAFNLGFHRLEIRCDETNKKSNQVAQRCQYTLEAILKDEIIQNNKYRTTNIYAKINPKDCTVTAT